MRAYGSDRVRQGKGEQFILFSPRSKGWLPRQSKTPGIAIVWDERIFEVVSAEQSGSSVRYVLEPWRDEHIIRVSDSYDEASEARREAEYHATLARERGRKTANFAGIFTGHLPAVVQEHLANELGLLSTKLTALSLLLPFAYLIWWINAFVRRILNPNLGPLPLIWTLIAGYVFLESAARLQIAWLHRRPIGSAAGWIVYLLYYVTVGKWRGALSPFTVQRGEKLYFIAPATDVALRDAFKVREPLATLLSPAEQSVLAQRFGYLYRAQSFVVAWLLLFFAAAGIITSLAKLEGGPSITAFLSLIVAGVVAFDQVVRLIALRRGPAGSMLAVFVRPLFRKLLT